MKNPQPNFELIKTAFYQAFVDSSQSFNALVLQSLSGKLGKPFPEKRRDFRKDFNNWLDGIDIRQVGVLIDILAEHKKSVPNWAVNRRYVLEYNENNMLDLIRTDINQF